MLTGSTTHKVRAGRCTAGRCLLVHELRTPIYESAATIISCSKATTTGSLSRTMLLWKLRVALVATARAKGLAANYTGPPTAQRLRSPSACCSLRGTMPSCSPELEVPEHRMGCCSRYGESKGRQFLPACYTSLPGWDIQETACHAQGWDPSGHTAPTLAALIVSQVVDQVLVGHGVSLEAETVCSVESTDPARLTRWEKAPEIFLVVLSWNKQC